MSSFSSYSKNRSDTVITIFALFAMLLAGGISIATINTDQQSKSPGSSMSGLADPLEMAEQAALAGLDAARGHIECHGIRARGGLPEHFYANGARYKVTWDDINLGDSTVFVVSTGLYTLGDGETCNTKLESVIKVDLMVSHEKPIFHEYYLKNSKYRTVRETNAP